MDRFLFSSLDDAGKVLDVMKKIIKSFGVVTVGDMNGLIGFETSYDDHNRGWVNLDSVLVSQDQDGNFYLNLPEPEVLSYLLLHKKG